jgi:FixJ family two-component response regulator
MHTEVIRLLYVNGIEKETRRVIEFLEHFKRAHFEIFPMHSAQRAIEFLQQQPTPEIIVTEDNLPDIDGIEFIRRLKELKFEIPIVFITSSKEVDFAVEVMRMGAKDYLLKRDVLSNVFPQALIRIVENDRIKQEMAKLEIKQKRLEAMQEIVLEISNKISEPLADMGKIVYTLEEHTLPEKATKYLKLIKDNVERMQVKLMKLQNLKEDKTVGYIRDIKMIDLS